MAYARICKAEKTLASLNLQH